MKAIVQDRYGTPDALELKDLEPPSIGENELLVRVHAAGLDRGVWHMMAGEPYLMRVMGLGFRGPKERPGMDVAGTVEAVGAEVDGIRRGDAIFGVCYGAYAEYAAVRADKCLRKPEGLSFEQAAAVPVSGITALQAVRDHGRVRPGQAVLVLGASGGVGTYAVQIARAFGATVTGVCGTSKVDLVRSLGAEDVIDYTRDEPTDGTRRWDVIVDIGGNRTLSRLRRALTPRGTLVIVGGEHGGPLLGGVDRLLRALLLSPFVPQRLRGFIAVTKREDLATLSDLIAAGKITPVVDRTFPLAEVPDAVRYLEQGRARGKVVITV